jgi:hypothetical protein
MAAPFIEFTEEDTGEIIEIMAVRGDDNRTSQKEIYKCTESFKIECTNVAYNVRFRRPSIVNVFRLQRTSISVSETT